MCTLGAPTKHRRFVQRVFAWFMAAGHDTMDKLYGERKRALFAGLSGTVLEIGPGAGANFMYYPQGLRLIAAEPNPFMHRYLRDEAAKHAVDMDLQGSRAEEIGLAPGSVDAIVCTLVLCSVDDPAQVVGEMRRLLKPGGRFIFIEHVVAAERTVLRSVQRGIAPLWQCIGDGCHPNRDTTAVLRDAGFTSLELEAFSIRSPMFVIAPHIAGTATV